MSLKKHAFPNSIPRSPTRNLCPVPYWSNYASQTNKFYQKCINTHLCTVYMAKYTICSGLRTFTHFFPDSWTLAHFFRTPGLRLPHPYQPPYYLLDGMTKINTSYIAHRRNCLEEFPRVQYLDHYCSIYIRMICFIFSMIQID